MQALCGARWNQLHRHLASNITELSDERSIRQLLKRAHASMLPEDNPTQPRTPVEMRLWRSVAFSMSRLEGYDRAASDRTAHIEDHFEKSSLADKQESAGCRLLTLIHLSI